MVTTLRRCCATCLYYRRPPGVHAGRCLHPERRPQTDVWPLVRGRELPCRRDWSRDLWEVRPDDEPGGELRVVGLAVWTVTGDPALDDLPADLLGWLVRGAFDGD